MEIKFRNALLSKRKSVLIFIMRTFILLCCTSVFSFSSGNLLSQNAKVIIEADMTITVEEVFDIIDRQTDFSFIYRSDLFENLPKVILKKGTFRINKLLLKSIDSKDFNFILTKDNVVKIKKKDADDKKQQIQVTGKVTGEGGLPLPGVTVLVKGTTKGVVTDFDGNYSISVPFSENILVFSFLGYQTHETVVGNQVLINVQLKPSVTGLDTAVVIGYGKVKKSQLTGSVGVVDMKNITNQAPTINIDNALQGQVAGVYVQNSNGQPGAAAKIRIRGTTSLLGSNQPLFVIDGIPVVGQSNIPALGSETGSLNSELLQQGLNTPLGTINAADIKSITILKDASASAIYGSRAANGVIIITTQQGAYSQKPTFSVNYSSSTQAVQALDALNAEQYRQVWTTAVENNTDLSPFDDFANSVLDGSYFGDADTNWQEELSPASPISTLFTLGVSGGSEKTKYYTSIGVNTQDGVLKGTAFNRYSYKLNLNTQINNSWKFSSSINVGFSDQKAIPGGVLNSAYRFRPDIPVFDENGDYAVSPLNPTIENPIATAQASDQNSSLLLLGSFSTELRLAKGLHAETLFTLNYDTGHLKSFYPRFTSIGGLGSIDSPEGDGYAQESRSANVSTLLQSTLTFDRLINDVHSIEAVLGVSFERNRNSYVHASGRGFFNDVLSNISSATNSNNGLAYEAGSGLESYFGRLNYIFDNKYFLTLSGRVDGASKFAKGNTHAFFPAAAAAWDISQEPFLDNINFVDQLKLRVSLGKTGQQQFGNYAWRSLFESSDYGGSPSVILTQLGNDRLKWETTNQFDLGLDFSLFKGRLSGTFGYYEKHTIDALFPAIAPGSTGATSITANVGNTENIGVELEIKGTIIQKDNFSWDLGFNISQNRNKLTKISDDFLDEDGFITGFSIGEGRLREGSPIGLIYGKVAEGIFQDQDVIDALNAASPVPDSPWDDQAYQSISTAPGDIRFKDLNGDGKIDFVGNDDETVIGDARPDFFGGINNTIRYKGFTLSTFFNFSVGNDLLAANFAQDISFSSRDTNNVTNILNAWTPDNRSSNIPRMVYRDPNRNSGQSSHYVYDASYIRLKTLTLNYAFSKELIDKLKVIKSFNLYFTAQNLFTITRYPGADPEATNLFNNDIRAGIDSSRFPSAKVFTIGARINF